MKNSKFEVRDARNLSILTDFYELTMANGFFESGRKDTIGVFDAFFRRVPDGGSFAISCGLEPATMVIILFLNFKATQILSKLA